MLKLHIGKHHLTEKSKSNSPHWQPASYKNSSMALSIPEGEPIIDKQPIQWRPSDIFITEQLSKRAGISSIYNKLKQASSSETERSVSHHPNDQD